MTLYHGRLVALTLCLLGLAAGPAAARPGSTLAESVAIAKRARVPIAVFVVRGGRVVVEEWHSYTTPTQETGPAWPVAEAHAKRLALMGAAETAEGTKTVPWAGFPVWTFAYPGGKWAIFESKRGTDHVWAILAVASWYWADAISPSFVMPADTRGYKLLGGKLIPIDRAATPAPVRPRATATPLFWKPPGW